MKKTIHHKAYLGLLLAFFTAGHLWGQTARDSMLTYAQDGWKAYIHDQPAQAEQQWRMALQYGRNDTIAYDLAESLALQGRHTEALEQYTATARHAHNDTIRYRAWNNAGDYYFRAKKYRQALEAYKNSLRANPHDETVRKKYALTKKLLEQQQKNNKNNQQNKQNQKNKNNRNNKNNQQNKNNKKDQNQQNNQNQKNKDNQQNQKDQKGQNNQNKDKNQQQGQNKEKNKDQNQGQNKPDEQKQKDKQDQQSQNTPGDQQKDRNQSGQQQNQSKGGQEGEQQQARQSKLSPEETRYLLNALKNKEQQTLQKIRWEKGKGKNPPPPEKDW